MTSAVGSVLENAGGVAVLVAHDFAAGDVLGVAVDARELHGLGIDKGHVSIEPPQKCRMIAGDIVDQLVGGQNRRIPALMIPKAVAKPRARGQSFCELSDALLELGLAVGGAEMHGDERTAADEEMYVRVVEAREEKASIEIDDARLGAGEFLNGGVIADGENLGTIERHCLSGGLRGIFSPHFSIDEYQVRLLRRRDVEACSEHNKDRV